jgi:cell division protein FtsB
VVDRTYPMRRYRVGPRRRRGRGSRVDWDRLGRVALVLVLFAILLSYLSPAIRLFGTWRESHTQRHHLTRLKQENAALKQRSAGLTDSNAVERQARDLGMVSSGEHAYVVHGLPSK